MPHPDPSATAAPLAPGGQPPLHLFLFHHAGGSASHYRRWLPKFPPAWRVRPLSLPESDPDWATAVDHLASAIGDHTRGPYALFGHSMGGLLAFDVTARLEARGERPPVWLGVSAYPQPAPNEPGRHLMPSERLRELAARLGGLPRIVLESDHLWPEVEARLRRDLALLESRTAGTPRVRTPLSLYCGQQDPVSGPSGMPGWQGLASRMLGVRVYPGGHFYFQNRVSDVVHDIVHDIRHCLPDERGEPCVP
ncbi:hypothetical protein A6A08_18965 [Nocardiopsis sp. TSRI0078]|uniref:thioesterase II family protein n=1 Tax=unclassified Nocardiopsis TaxID=2649073 RepID=UPI00093E4567|nr:alpha/beta fold hydrolase [Nocardiopsis sp. TSRI0078]OKI22358.1 hypothetical protein A6A08_18965 [Nocardiopsis sp. TSRI0078]